MDWLIAVNILRLKTSVEFSLNSKQLLSNNVWFREQAILDERPTKRTSVAQGLLIQRTRLRFAKSTSTYSTREDLISWLLIGWWFWGVYFYPYILNTLTMSSSCYWLYYTVFCFFLSDDETLVTALLWRVDLISWLIFGLILLRLAQLHFDPPQFLVNSLLIVVTYCTVSFFIRIH